MFKSINDARYTMWATVIPRLDSATMSTGNQPTTGTGHYERGQDPDSGQITTIWVPDRPDATVKTNANSPQYDIPCYARGYTNLGFRSSANREIYVKGEYNITEAIQFDYPAWVSLNDQTIVTKIRGHQEDTDYLWLDQNSGQPIYWEVQGVTPVTDPFGKLLRYTTVLKRSEIQ